MHTPLAKLRALYRGSSVRTTQSECKRNNFGKAHSNMPVLRSERLFAMVRQGDSRSATVIVDRFRFALSIRWLLFGSQPCKNCGAGISSRRTAMADRLFTAAIRRSPLGEFEGPHNREAGEEALASNDGWRSPEGCKSIGTSPRRVAAAPVHQMRPLHAKSRDRGLCGPRRRSILSATATLIRGGPGLRGTRKTNR